MRLQGQEQVIEKGHVGSLGNSILPVRTKIELFCGVCSWGGEGGSSVLWSSLPMMPGMERSKGIRVRAFCNM